MTGVGRSSAFGLTVAMALVLGLLAPMAAAEGPGDKARAALELTGKARSARIAVTHRFSAKDRALEQRVEGALSGGDHDVVVQGEGGKARQVAVGTTLYERRPDQQGSPWRRATREAPAGGTALGPLTLADGTHIGDPKLQLSATSAGTETLHQGPAEKLVLELDMAAVAAAMRLSGADAARLARMQGTLTLWVADGRVARNTLRLVIPGDAGPTMLETTVELSDLDAPITVSAPTGP